MNQEQAIAYLMAQVVCAQAEIEGMKAMNRERESQGYALAYDKEAFFNVPNKYGIHHNAVLDLFRDSP